MLDEPEIDSEYVEVMSQIDGELVQIWAYLERKYEVPSEFLVTAFLDHAFDQAILDCGSGLGAVVGFQHAVGELAEDSMAREMRIFRHKVN